MWTFTEIDQKNINSIYQYFLPKFSKIDKDILYNRIFCGYCWGEGSFPIISLNDWNDVFYNGKFKKFLTVFDDWEDYLRYKGDWHLKCKSISSQRNLEKKGKLDDSTLQE